MRLLLIPITFAACVADPGPEEPFASAGSAGTTGAAAEAGRGGAPATAGAGGKASGAGAAGKVSAGGAAGGKAGSSGKTAAGSGGTSNVSGGPQGGSSAGTSPALPGYCRETTPAAPGKGCPANAGGIVSCAPECGTFSAYHACYGKYDAPTTQAGACQEQEADGIGVRVFCCERYSCTDEGTDCPDKSGRFWSCPTTAKPPTGSCIAYGESGTIWCCK